MTATAGLPYWIPKFYRSWKFSIPSAARKHWCITGLKYIITPVQRELHILMLIWELQGHIHGLYWLPFKILNLWQDTSPQSFMLLFWRTQTIIRFRYLFPVKHRMRQTVSQESGQTLSSQTSSVMIFQLLLTVQSIMQVRSQRSNYGADRDTVTVAHWNEV